MEISGSKLVMKKNNRNHHAAIKSLKSKERIVGGPHADKANGREGSGKVDDMFRGSLIRNIYRTELILES